MKDMAKSYQLHSQASRDQTSQSYSTTLSPQQIVGKIEKKESGDSYDVEENNPEEQIQQHVTKPTKIIVYFHGNAEDVGISYELMVKMSVTFKCSVIAMEYPGYGIYRTEQADADTLMTNAHILMQYLIHVQKYCEKDIILVGRSMGSGPASALAVEYPSVSALILLSPYTSLKQAVKTLLGTLASLIVRERFENLKLIQKVRCPTLLIHGQKDEIIPESHAIQLHQNCGGPSKLIMPIGMTHNEFDMQKDIIRPIEQFFLESNVVPTVTEGNIFTIPKSMARVPPAIQAQANEKDKQSLAKMILESENERDGERDALYSPQSLIKIEDHSSQVKLLAEKSITAPISSTQHINKSLMDTQAQFAAASGEYSVFHAARLAPGPNHSLGVGPLGMGRHSEIQNSSLPPMMNKRASACAMLPQSMQQQQKDSRQQNRGSKEPVKRVRTISQLAVTRKNSKNHQSMSMVPQQMLKGSSSTNASILKPSVAAPQQNKNKNTQASNTKNRNLGQFNTNVSNMLDRSLGDVKKFTSNQTITESKKQLMRFMKSDRSRRHRKALAYATQQIPIAQADPAPVSTFVNQNIASDQRLKEYSPGRTIHKRQNSSGSYMPQTVSGAQEDNPYAAASSQAFVMTPEQNIRKHSKPPNLAIPNKAGKPLSWCTTNTIKNNFTLDESEQSPLQTPNEPDMLKAALLYMGASTVFAADYDEPDMSGVEENVESQARIMHEGKSRVRKSKNVKTLQEPSVKKVQQNDNNGASTMMGSRRLSLTLNEPSQHQASDDDGQGNQQNNAFKKALNDSMINKANEYGSLPVGGATLSSPKFSGWQKLVINVGDDDQHTSKETSTQKQSKKSNKKQQDQQSLHPTKSNRPKAGQYSRLAPKDIGFKTFSSTNKFHAPSFKKKPAAGSSLAATTNMMYASTRNFQPSSTVQKSNRPQQQQLKNSFNDNFSKIATQQQQQSIRQKQNNMSQQSPAPATSSIQPGSTSTMQHAMRQSQRGSKVHILEQGGTSTASQPTPHAAKKRRTTYAYMPRTVGGNKMSIPIPPPAVFRQQSENLLIQQQLRSSDMTGAMAKSGQNSGTKNKEEEKKCFVGETSSQTADATAEMMREEMDHSRLTAGNTSSNSAQTNSDVNFQKADKLCLSQSKPQHQQTSSQFNSAHHSTTSAAGIKLVTIPLQLSQNKSSMKTTNMFAHNQAKKNMAKRFSQLPKASSIMNQHNISSGPQKAGQQTHGKNAFFKLNASQNYSQRNTQESQQMTPQQQKDSTRQVSLSSDKNNFANDRRNRSKSSKIRSGSQTKGSLSLIQMTISPQKQPNYKSNFSVHMPTKNPHKR